MSICMFQCERGSNQVRDCYWDRSWNNLFVCWCLQEWARWNHSQRPRKSYHTIMGFFHRWWEIDWWGCKESGSCQSRKDHLWCQETYRKKVRPWYFIYSWYD